MITFRYHIVSIVSVFLALAVGVALGGGPLKGEVDDSIVQELAASREREVELRTQIRDARSNASFTDQVIAEAGPALLSGALTDVPVALVTVPGAVPSSVDRVGDAIEAAGGSVTGTYRMSPALTDPGERSLVDQLTQQLSTDVAGLELADDGTPYERIGQLVARAVATPADEGAATDAASESIVSGLSTGGLMLGQNIVESRATAIVVVTGNPPTDLSAAYAGFAEGLADGSDATVVAGPATAVQTDRLLRRIRNDATLAEAMSTVDSVDTGVGGLITALAIRQSAIGPNGHFGAVEAADGALPDDPGA
ncbi:copper transporter [Alteromonas gracilis]